MLRIFHLFSVLTLLSTVLQVDASIFPTCPVASTVWTAGQSANVTWGNDDTAPALKNMGVVSIELYSNIVRAFLFLVDSEGAERRGVDACRDVGDGHRPGRAVRGRRRTSEPRT